MAIFENEKTGRFAIARLFVLLSFFGVCVNYPYSYITGNANSKHDPHKNICHIPYVHLMLLFLQIFFLLVDAILLYVCAVRQ